MDIVIVSQLMQVLLWLNAVFLLGLGVAFLIVGVHLRKATWLAPRLSVIRFFARLSALETFIITILVVLMTVRFVSWSWTVISIVVMIIVAITLLPDLVWMVPVAIRPQQFEVLIERGGYSKWGLKLISCGITFTVGAVLCAAVGLVIYFGLKLVAALGG